MHRRYPESVTFRLAKIRNKQIQDLRSTRGSFNWRDDPAINKLKQFSDTFKLNTDRSTDRSSSDFCKIRNKIDLDSTIYGPLQDYSNDFRSLLRDGTFSDISIKCGTEVFKVHRNILASRSPVFAAMFRSDMKESAEGLVVITDLQPQVVKDLVTFIYANKVVDLTLVRACDLLDAAEKYQIQSLKDICSIFLSSNLTVDNAFLVLQKAVLYDKWLETRAVDYISEKFNDLSATQEWRDLKLTNPKLALEISSIVIDKLSRRNADLEEQFVY